MQSSIILFRGEESVLKKSQVESFPVKTDKKLSAITRVPTGTKSAKKRFRVIAKW